MSLKPHLREIAQGLAAFVLAIAPMVAGAANSVEVDRGLAWLSQRPQADGTVSGETTSIATSLQVRAETLATLRQFATAPTPLANLIAQQPIDSSEYLARQVAVLASLGFDVSTATATLVARQNDDGGFGAAPGYQSNALDTSYTLLALKAANSPNTAAIGRALAYLGAVQGTDGSFGINEQSSIFITASALGALNAFTQTYALSASIQAAKGWLAAAQTAGAYTSVLDNAVASLALAGATLDSSVFAGAQAALKAAQSADGSWAADPYLTAIAIRALAATASAPPPASTGQVSGTVIDQATSASLSGVQVALTGAQSASATTDASGGFAVAGLAPGSYTVAISKAGYSTASIPVTVTVGVTSNLGTIRLQAATTTASLQGVVRDGSTGTAITGATVAIAGGASATTDAAGSYQLGGLIPGPATVTVTKTGYQSATISTTLSAGVVLYFSPSLYAPGQGPTDATLTGKVADLATGQPVAGASVKIGTSTTTTAANGTFTLAGLTVGNAAIEVSAAGYVTANLTATLAQGVNNVGTITIARTPASVRISGRVSDAASNLPIGGATVRLVGSTLTATTNSNGNYELAGITQTQFTLAVAAAGYQSKNIAVTLPTLADSTVNATLDAVPPSTVVLRRVSTALPSYGPFKAIEIELDVQNTSSAAASILFTATVLDPLGNPIHEVPGTMATIAANTQVEVELETHLAADPAGTYSILVRGFALDGTLAVEGSTSFQVLAVSALGGGIGISPPIVQAGTNQPVSLNANLSNNGNVPIAAGGLELTVTLTNPEADVTPRATLDLLPGGLAGAPLNFPAGGSFDAQGNYYTVNRLDRRVVRIAADGQTTIVATLPSFFSSPGLNVNPVDSRADAAGNVFVLNTNSEIFKVAPDGNVTRIPTNLDGTLMALDVEADGTFDVLRFSGTYRLTRIAPSGSQVTTIAAGLSHPRGMVRGADGDFYITNSGDHSISRMTSAGLLTSFVTTGLETPHGITIDGAGNLYVMNAGQNNVIKVTPSGQTSLYGTGLNAPAEGAFDAQGNLLVTNSGNHTVARIPPGGGAAQVWASALISAPLAIQYDASGNLFLASNGQLVKLDPSDNATVLSNGVSNPRAIAISPSGDAFIAEGPAGRIKKSTNGVSSTFATGLTSPYGLAFVGGTLYMTENAASSRVLAFDAAGNATTASETIGTSLQDLYIAPNGDRYVLSYDQIARVPAGNTPAQLVVRGGFGAVSFAPASDGGFFVQQNTSIARVSPTGVVSIHKNNLNLLTWGIVADAANNLLVAESSSRNILRIDAGGNVTTVATTADFINSLTDDGAGGLFLAFNNGRIGRMSAAGVVTYLTTSPIGSVERVAYDASTNKLYVLNGNGITTFDIATRAVTNVISHSGWSAIRLAGGKLSLTNYSNSELDEVSLQGVLTNVTTGYSFPSALTSDGTKLYFNDGGRTISMVPGQLPKVIAISGNMRQIAWRNGKLYGTTGAQVYTMTPGVNGWAFYLTAPSQLSGIAFRADGAFTLASDTDSRVTTYDASAQVIASYAGINAPAGIAIDSSGFVYVASAGNSQILRITPNGKQSAVFATALSGNALAFDAGGQLYSTSFTNLIRMSPTGQLTTVASSPIALYGLSVSAAGIFAVEDSGSLVRKQSGNLMVPFAAGLADPKRILSDGAGGVLVANVGNDTVTRVANDMASTRAVGVIGATSLALAAGGDLIVGGNRGHMYRVDPAGANTEISNLSSVFGIPTGVSWLAIDGAGVVSAMLADRSELRKLAYHPPVVPPPAGTVVYTATRTFAGLEVNAAPTPVDFGTWLPPYGGDFAFNIRPTGGLQGGVSNVLHVGAHANGEIIPAKASLPPGNSPVGVTVKVEGADFTSIARVDPTNISIAVSTGVYPRAMGADAAGNVLVTTGDAKVLKINPSGGSATLYTLPGSQTVRMLGTLPVDDAQNIYVSGGPLGRDVIRVAPDGTATPFATLSENIVSLARARNDVIYALTTNRLWRIDTAGGVTLASPTTLPFPYSIAIDGKDNIYIQNNDNTVHMVKPDGSMTNLLRPEGGNPSFEFEGMNIAGDCSDNVFVTPYRWDKFNQNGEEAVLVQVVGRTGLPAQVLDGRTINPQLLDLDFIVYDRFSGSLLMWTDLAGGRMYRIPVACGAISADVHVVFPASQPASGFSAAPKAVMTRPNGSVEYVWSLKDVTNLGKSVSFTTTLQNLKLGDIAPVASEAFLVFQNTFVNGDVVVPLKVPTVTVDGMVDLGVSTDRTQYDANTDVIGQVMLTNRDGAAAKGGNLVVEITDPQGSRVTVTAQQGVAIAAGAVLAVSPPFNTGTFLTGSYLMKATLTDVTSGVVMATASAGFDIVAPGVTLVSSVTTDKQSYEAIDAVNIAGRVRNVSVNAIANGLTVRIVVRDPAGNQIFAGSGAVAVLVPQALKDASFLLRLNSAAAGSYSVEETLVDASGAVLETHTVSFTVLSSADTGSGLRGAVAATKRANRGDPVAITVTIRNQGNAALTGVPLSIKVINPASGQLVQQWTSSVSLAQGAQQQVIQSWDTAAAAAGTYIASASATFGGREIPLGQDTVTLGVILPFSFTSITNAPLSTVVESGSVAIGGIVTPAAISITGGELRVGSGAWGTSTTMVNAGDLVTVRVTSAATPGTIKTASVTVAGFTATFSVTTLASDTTPDPFSFTAQANVPLGSVRTSNTVTITGIDAPVPISIVGGEFCINGGAWVSAAGMIASGNTVAVRLTSANTLGTTTTATLTVSGVSATFNVITTAQDATPDAFGFTAQSNVPLGTLRASNTVTVTGFNVAVPISIVGGEYSINGGAWTSAAGTISSGNTVAVRATSSATPATTVTATLTIGGVTGIFSVTTTGDDSTVDPFSFTAQVDVPLNTARTSNAIIVAGINVNVPIRVAGGEYSVNGAAFTAADGTVKNGDSVVSRLASSTSYDTAKVANVTIAQFSTSFSVTTMGLPKPVVTHAFAQEARVLVLASSARKGFLDTYLTSLGIDHKVVSDSDAFRSEMRCGLFNAYWISGGAAKLTGTLAEEVREAVYRGDALVVDGAHDSRSAVLDEALGVHFVSTATQSSTVLIGGSIFAAGSFTHAGGGLKFTLQGATRQASFGTTAGDPAILSNTYGSGRAMEFAFDFAGTLQAQSTSTQLRTLVQQAFTWLAPAPLTKFTADGYVGIVTTVQNPATTAQTVDVTATLPTGFAFLSSTPAPQTTTATQVTWHVPVAASQSVVIEWAVRAPLAAATHNVAFQANRTAPVSDALPGTSLAIEVTSIDPSTTQVVTALNALSPTPTAERQARDRAVTSILDAQAKAGQGLYEGAIAKYLSAGDDIGLIASLPAAAGQQIAVDKLMQEVERKWCRGGSACSVGSATGSAYSLIVFGSASLSNGSATGAVGIGGAASLSSYFVATALSGDAARLVAGNTLSWSNGSVGQNSSGVIRVTGTNTVAQNVGRRELTTGSVEDWTAIRTDQLARADSFAAMSGVAATTSAGNALNCTGTNGTWNVCTITAPQLNAARSINLSYPATASVLVNVTGAAATLTNGRTNFNGAAIQGSTASKQVIFNMAQMSSLTINTWGWGGTLLAPRASVTHSNSMIDGQAVFNTLSSTGNFACTGTFEGSWP
jgi:choice-of-anchor A domain-containing protein